MPKIMQQRQTTLRLLESLIGQNPQKAAQELAALPLAEACSLLGSIKNESIIPCLENMPPKNAAFLLRRLPSKQAALILCRMQSQKAAETAAQLPEHYKNKLASENAETLENLENILSYPKDSAGRLMRPAPLSFKTDVKVADITERLKNYPKSKLPIVIFVLDKAGRLAGSLKTAELAFLSAQSPLGSVMTRREREETLLPADDAAKISRIYKKSGDFYIPVVDKEGLLLGIITPEQIIEICSRELPFANNPNTAFERKEPCAQNSKSNLDNKKYSWQCCAAAAGKTFVLLAALAAAVFVFLLMTLYFNL